MLFDIAHAQHTTHTLTHVGGFLGSEAGQLDSLVYQVISQKLGEGVFFGAFWAWLILCFFCPLWGLDCCPVNLAPFPWPGS